MIDPPVVRVTKENPLPRHYIYAGYPDTDPSDAAEQFRLEYKAIPMVLYELGKKKHTYLIPIDRLRSTDD